VHLLSLKGSGANLFCSYTNLFLAQLQEKCCS